jgi:hypothetical protein
VRPSPHLREILGLDPVVDNERIVHLDVCYEFPFDTTRSLELALFRTFAVPSIAHLLDQTKEFERRPQRRYDDTDLILSTIAEAGHSSERGRAAIRRMNQIHGRFEIASDDFLYVLSSFVYDPIRWNERFGWRLLVEQERLAAFHFWREVGRLMAIRGIPDEYDEFERFNRDYERSRFRRTDASVRVGEATRDMFAAWFPGFPRALVEQGIAALMDEPLREAFGFRRPSKVIRAAAIGGLRARSRLVRLVPSRRRPRLRTQMRHRSYPRGYRLDELGPPVATSSSRRSA